MIVDVRPYRWDRVPRVDRRQQRALAALARWWPQSAAPPPPPSLAPLSATVVRVEACARQALAERLTDPTSFALRLRRSDGAAAFAVVAGRLGAQGAVAVLGLGQRERLAAPRAVTRSEQGVCAFIAAALLERYGVDDVAVEPWYEPPPTLPERLGGAVALAIELVVEVAGARGAVLLFAADSVLSMSPPPRPVEGSFALCGHRLDGARFTARVVSGFGRVAMRDLLQLARRDVLLLDESPRPDAGRLVVGRGGFPVTIDEAGATIAGAYERGAIMDEAVAEDVTVEVACQLGAVPMSARQVLELAPGQVLTLDRPLGGPVELVVGTRVIGRGELVDVDGELGVRVLALNPR